MNFEYNMGNTFSKQYLNELKRQNESLRRTGNKMSCIKIKQIVPDNSVLGGYEVWYFDYRIKSDSFASINDILYWVQIGEIYVDNFIYLLSFIRNSGKEV